MNRRDACRWMLASAGAGVGAAPGWAQAQASALAQAQAQTQPPSGMAEHGLDPVASRWRAMSRFGYAPDPHAVATPGRDWALRQLTEAVRTSRLPARVLAALSGFELPLPGVFERFQHEREQRRQGTALDDPPFGREVFLKAATWRLQACSQPDVENPLLARMTEFWFNHLNVSGVKGAVRPFVGHYLVHAIRPHALGQFEDLLLASARHPAMLFYLNQTQSVAAGSPERRPAAGGQGVPRARGINENYAREVMELHTLGVNGGYAQSDITELARILTGWTVDPKSDSGFRFAARQHDGGSKRLLGHAVEASGEAEGEWALRLLARHPATAQRIALRLGQWFVADQPPAALVQRLAQRFLATHGDIAATLETLMKAPETWDARHRLFKTPFDFACSALAWSGGMPDERAVRQTMGYLSSASQPLLGWQTPDGYPTAATTWLSPEALSRRADFAMQVGRNVADPSALQRWLTPASRQRIAQEPESMRAGLALASPDFMWK